MTAASSSHKCRYICYLFTFITEACIAHDRNTFINIGKGSVWIEAITAHNIFRPPSRTSWSKRYQERRDCPRKSGKRAGMRAILIQLGPKAIPLPSLLLANVQSHENKMDDIRLRLTQQQQIFTETWLYPNILDQAISLNERTMFCPKHKTQETDSVASGSEKWSQCGSALNLPRWWQNAEFKASKRSSQRQHPLLLCSLWFTLMILGSQMWSKLMDNVSQMSSF